MIQAQNLFYNVALAPTSFTNGATATSGLIDTLGYHYASIAIQTSTADSTSHGPTTLALQEADVTNASSFVNVATFTGGGTGGFTIPLPPTATSNEPYVLWNVDCRRRKRYLRVLYSPQTTQTVTVLALLFRADASPVGDILASAQNISGIVVTG